MAYEPLVRGHERGALRHKIRAGQLGRDIGAVLRSMVGGEIREYTKMMAEAREQALDRMKEEAEALGADAIVGVRLTTSMLMSGAAEIVAFGSREIVAFGAAVRLEG